jgi:hypothetical protein
VSESNAKVVITFKAGKDYDDPWIVLHGQSVDEVGELLKEVRAKGVFAAVQAAALEFQDKQTGQAVRNVQAAMPGAEVIQQLPDSMKPRCPVCNAAGVEKTGHSTKQGRDYRGVFCPNDHKPIEFTWTS